MKNETNKKDSRLIIISSIVGAFVAIIVTKFFEFVKFDYSNTILNILSYLSSVFILLVLTITVGFYLIKILDKMIKID